MSKLARNPWALLRSCSMNISCVLQKKKCGQSLGDQIWALKDRVEFGWTSVLVRKVQCMRETERQQADRQTCRH